MIPENYIPPLTERGSPCDPGNPSRLAPGVFGYAIKSGNKIYIPDIHAEKEGNGDVGRMLDRLHPSCVIANVVSRRLRGMLEGRGWKVTLENVPEEQGGGSCDVWIHTKAGVLGRP